jgi:hypothetical protein
VEAQLKPNQRPHPTTSVITTYFFAERVDILRQRYPLSPIIPALAVYHDAIADFRAGKPVTTVITDPGIAWYDSKELWISKLLLEPMIAHIAGDEQAMPRALADLATIHRWQFLQQPWYAGEYLSGRIDEAAFLAQPCVANSDQILAVCRGLRCELQGDHLGALTAYRDFLERPPHQRALLGWLRDPIAEVFIHWRVEALAAQHP